MIHGRLIAAGVAVVSLSLAVIVDNRAEREKVSTSLTQAVSIADAVSDSFEDLKRRDIPFSEAAIEKQLLMHNMVPKDFIHNHVITSPISDNMNSHHYVPVSIRMDNQDIIIEFPHVTPQRTKRIQKYIKHKKVHPHHDVTVEASGDGNLEMRVANLD